MRSWLPYQFLKDAPRDHLALGAGVFLWLLAIAWPAQADELSIVEEYELKAAFTYKFTFFISWPKHENDNETLKFCVIGDQLRQSAFRTLDGLPVEKRKIVPSALKPDDSYETCELVFITGRHTQHAEEVIQSASELGILTIGESEGFARKGGMIGLVQVGKKLRFEINLKAVREAGFGMSSQLLGLARQVYD